MYSKVLTEANKRLLELEIFDYESENTLHDIEMLELQIPSSKREKPKSEGTIFLAIMNCPTREIFVAPCEDNSHGLSGALWTQRLAGVTVHWHASRKCN